MEQSMNNKELAVYCHFSFKRPKGKNYGLFAVAFYYDFEGKRLAAQATRRLPLWKDHQFVTAIQAYEHALYSIHHWQGIMKSRGINKVYLVTDNSTLAGWIENPKKNKQYTEYMNRAVAKYQQGASDELKIDVGLCEVRDYEKSYKYCKEDKVIDDVQTVVADSESGKYVLDLEAANIQYSTITDVIKSSPMSVEIEGLKEN